MSFLEPLQPGESDQRHSEVLAFSPVNDASGSACTRTPCRASCLPPLLPLERYAALRHIDEAR
jgi:hypothetical protein